MHTLHAVYAIGPQMLPDALQAWTEASATFSLFSVRRPLKAPLHRQHSVHLRSTTQASGKKRVGHPSLGRGSSVESQHAEKRGNKPAPLKIDKPVAADELPPMVLLPDGCRSPHRLSYPRRLTAFREAMSILERRVPALATLLAVPSAPCSSGSAVAVRHIRQHELSSGTKGDLPTDPLASAVGRSPDVTGVADPPSELRGLETEESGRAAVCIVVAESAMVGGYRHPLRAPRRCCRSARRRGERSDPRSSPPARFRPPRSLRSWRRSGRTPPWATSARS